MATMYAHILVMVMHILEYINDEILMFEDCLLTIIEPLSSYHNSGCIHTLTARDNLRPARK